MEPPEKTRPLEIAVIGAGIVGLALALGLARRGVHVQVYEQYQNFAGFGGGIGFSPNAMRCMKLLEPRLVDAQRKLSTASGDPNNPMDDMIYLDGYHTQADGEEAELFRLYTGPRGFEGVVRAHFRDEMIKLLPPDVLHMDKRLEQIVEKGDASLKLTFQDGSSVEADAVIGCDGIKSKTRSLILGQDHPAVLPSYTHLYALRNIVPMERAVQALGEHKAKNRHIHIGPGAYVITIPVALGKMLNVAAFVYDPNDWPATSRLTTPAVKEEAIGPFSRFGPEVRGIIDAIAESSDTMDKWAIFDTYDNPPPTYHRGRICLAGDSAHAAAPHHGAGAGCGMEDNLALSSLLARVSADITATATASSTPINRAAALRAAFAAYTDVRYPRTRWLVQSSRFLGEMLVWRNPVTGTDFELCGRELFTRSHTIWDFEENAMLADLEREYEQHLGKELAEVTTS